MMLRQFSNEINAERKWEKKLKGHYNSVAAVSFCSDQYLASGDHDGRLLFWDLKSCKQMSEIKVHEGIGIWAMQTGLKVPGCHDRLIVTGSSKGDLSLIDFNQSSLFINFFV